MSALVRFGVLQCVVLQCVAVCCSVLQSVGVCQTAALYS